jgi:hypothetical protein
MCERVQLECNFSPHSIGFPGVSFGSEFWRTGAERVVEE